MRITVDIRGIEAVKAKLAGLGKQIPFAAAKALTLTAKDVEAAEIREMKDIFDRPTPNTLKSTYIKPATKQRLVAEVGLKDFAGKGVPASKYLAAEIAGGSRRDKRFEKALRAVGALPPGYSVVPGAGAQIDAYGNMFGSQIVQILSYFKAFPEAGYKANMTDKRRAALKRGSKTKQGVSYFVGRPGGGTQSNSHNFPLGVWQRIHFAHGTAVKPIMVFVPSVTYQAIFDFEYVARKTVDKRWQINFDTALAEAIRTAHP